jgi:hypothetical protein
MLRDSIFSIPIVHYESFMFDFKFTVNRVHAVKFTLKLESQLHLFLMILTILHIFFFQFKSEGPLISPFPFEFL